MSRPSRCWSGVAALTGLAFLVPAAGAATDNIFTVAGTGMADFTGDGVLATAAPLNTPIGVVAAADGGTLIADLNNHRVRRVSPSGTITTVAGTGVPGSSADGVRATAAQIDDPIAVAVTTDGGFVFVERGSHRVRRVSPGATIATVAGTGASGFSGDGGPAIGARLNGPSAVAMAADGGVLIADTANHRVRRVSPGGTITTVAGTGASGFSGDDGPATAAALSAPSGVAATAEGGVLIADTANHRVRRVSPGGTISTVAGTTRGFSGDGGPARAAQLDFPFAVAGAADGVVLIADFGNHRVRRVSPGGMITTVVGTGAPGFAGDGGPATSAQITGPAGLALTAEGGVLVADALDHRVRFVDVDLRSPASGPRGPGGPAGPSGPLGPGADRLAVALATDRLRARPRQRLRVRYAASATAAVELRVLRAGRRIARARGRARAGANAIRLRAPRKAGRYRLVLTAVAADGQRSSDRVRLTVLKPRRAA